MSAIAFFFAANADRTFVVYGEERYSFADIRAQAVREGMKTLRQDALEKLAAGLTTPEEVVRVTKAI